MDEAIGEWLFGGNTAQAMVPVRDTVLEFRHDGDGLHKRFVFVEPGSNECIGFRRCTDRDREQISILQTLDGFRERLEFVFFHAPREKNGIALILHVLVYGARDDGNASALISGDL